MMWGFKKCSYLQFLEIAALARSIESPSNDDKFATSYGPLSSFTEGAALEIMRFFLESNPLATENMTRSPT